MQPMREFSVLQLFAAIKKSQQSNLLAIPIVLPQPPKNMAFISKAGIYGRKKLFRIRKILLKNITKQENQKSPITKRRIRKSRTTISFSEHYSFIMAWQMESWPV